MTNVIAAAVFSTEHSGTTSTGTVLANVLPFTAYRWDVQNGGTLPLYLNLGSSEGSTGAPRVGPGETLKLEASSARFALLTTSTSTDGTDHRIARVRATGD